MKLFGSTQAFIHSIATLLLDLQLIVAIINIHLAKPRQRLFYLPVLVTCYYDFEFIRITLLQLILIICYSSPNCRNTFSSIQERGGCLDHPFEGQHLPVWAVTPITIYVLVGYLISHLYIEPFTLFISGLLKKIEQRTLKRSAKILRGIPHSSLKVSSTIEAVTYFRHHTDAKIPIIFNQD